MTATFRRASQFIFFTIFLAHIVLVGFSPSLVSLDSHNPLFNLDPLISLSLVLSSHDVYGISFMVFLMILLAMVFGRIFCGWICPLGFVNELLSLKILKKKEEMDKINPILFPDHGWRYCLLFFLLGSSLFSLQILGYFDPIILMIRSFSLFLFPYISHFLYLSGLDRGENGIHFTQSFLMGTLFIAILALNGIYPRFWCRNLCPLGSLFIIMGHFSPIRLKRQGGCVDCNRCVLHCPGRNYPKDADKWQKDNCLLCGNCVESCPEKALVLGLQNPFKWKEFQGVDPMRRKVIYSLGAGIALVPIFKNSWGSRFLDSKLIRPPGSLEEEEFLKRCLKCGQCMGTCPSNGLQPATTQAGLEGIWSPILVPMVGPCEYDCNRCGRICPSGAIKPLELEEKRKTRIGMAFLDKSRCIPHFLGKDCTVCFDNCPLYHKAIKLTPTLIPHGDDLKEVKVPSVITDLCIGCGVCENKCPVVGGPAIIVRRAGRSKNGIVRY